MEKIGIFCSASENIDKMYFESARQIGEWMGQKGKTLIYGGASLGLMECVARAVKENGVFRAPARFEETRRSAEPYIGYGTKMGEGWLLPAEMAELIHSGVPNVVVVQPFGCLPNHIIGKGMMKPMKEKNPGANIVAIDYDAGATKINQENRLKLMLAAAREHAEENQSAEVRKTPAEKELLEV